MAAITPSEANSAAPRTPPTAPPTITELSLGHFPEFGSADVVCEVGNAEVITADAVADPST